VVNKSVHSLIIFIRGFLQILSFSNFSPSVARAQLGNVCAVVLGEEIQHKTLATSLVGEDMVFLGPLLYSGNIDSL